MSERIEVKKAIIEKYDREAREKNTEQWLEQGNDPRVPEGKAAHYFIDRKVREALNLCAADLSSCRDALEIGCSFGQMTSLLAGRFERLTAVDISPESVAIAEKRMRRYGITNVSFVADDAEVLSRIPDESFDAVFSFSTVRFCPDPVAALRAMRAKLRPGGVAVVDFPNRHSPWHVFVKSVLGIRKHINDRLYTAREAEQLFRDAGFEVERVKLFLFTTRRLPASLLPLFRIVDFVLERIPPFPRLAGIIMVKGRKT
ncbi:MAG: class I SAM-dependent methyltransferase [Chlorobi bacterium]|nr:class I SAM-dependent methyltransferase [Chlorobiota bacterium]